MNTILVWVLVTISQTGNGGSNINYSPPVADLQSCQFLQKQVDVLSPRTRIYSQCVQIKVYKGN